MRHKDRVARTQHGGISHSGDATQRVRDVAAQCAEHSHPHPADQVDVDAIYLRSVGRLLHVGWLFVLIVAACSFTVGMIAGVIERRPFAPLRASGLRLGGLREVVLLEAAIAMLVTAAVVSGSAWRRRAPWRCSASWRGRGRMSACSP